ncbi:hypothetical protein SCLCIDRAFT_110307 [Scleroderma citrinum Foug A]|uniref:Uncharacterized protein n=1 Tax=Scleroderma citrinum Foug A TaxID=1036808 RepID=A0A0C3ANA7_9AGAM|nr:hypothetical protein SCLCIDRAFT_110307 [Scleroderma citrinum Foug A]
MFFVKALVYLTTWLTLVFAQSAQLLAPPAGTTLKAGSNFTVQVEMGGYPENIDTVAIVIGLMHCTGTCSPPSQFMGSILYQGPYTPVSGQYYANYSVAVPSGFQSGTASLNVIDFFMVGASYVPVIDYLNVTVTVS